MEASTLLPRYSTSAPSNQSVIDIFAGHWVSAFPKNMSISAGSTEHFDQNIEQRVEIVREVYDLRGKSVLELGPLEGYQTKHLCDAGANPVVAVEANDIAYLKCLIVKELMNIDAKFLFGDILEHLKSTTTHYDAIWASGVLYHQTDPLLLLKEICDHCDAFFLWSQFWTEEVAQTSQHFDASKDQIREIDGFQAKYHFRPYGGSIFAGFSGGVEAFSMWMERAEIMDFVTRQGFDIKIEKHSQAPLGAVMLFFATRR